jgi:hypothetical protein
MEVYELILVCSMEADGFFEMILVQGYLIAGALSQAIVWCSLSGHSACGLLNTPPSSNIERYPKHFLTMTSRLVSFHRHTGVVVMSVLEGDPPTMLPVR